MMKQSPAENSAAEKSGFDLSSAALHLIAMTSMLIDHTLKTVIESDNWIIVLGRLAFPIFAFMAAEGYYRTRNYRRYLIRMLLFAVLSEIPYDLMKTGQMADWYDQNVIWTFLLALLCIRLIDLAKKKGKRWAFVLTAAAVTFAGFLLGMLFMTDYNGFGVLTVLIFYLFHERTWQNKLVQFALLLFINAVALGAFGPALAVPLFGKELEIPLQGFAVFSLIPIWMYRGRQGHHSKAFQYFCYAFYPVHMLILSAIAKVL